MEQLVDVTGVVDESMRKSSSETEIEKPLQNNRRDLDLIVQDIKNKQNQNVQYSKTKPELDTKADSVFPRNYSAFGNQNIKSETNSLERKSLLLQRLTEGTDELSNNEEKSKMDTSVDDNEQMNDKNQEKFKALGKRNYQYVYCDHKDIVNNNNPQLECVSSHCEHSDIQYESLSKNLKTSHPQTLSLLSTSSSTNLVHLKEENLYKSKVFHNDKPINGSAENDLLIGDTNGVNRMEFESYSNNDKDISANDDIKITNVESLSRGRPSNEDPSNTNINLKVTDTSGEMDSMDKKQTFFSYSEIKNCLSPQRSPLKSLVSSKAQVENQESRLNLMRKKDFSNPVALPELKVEADDSVTKSISNEIPEPSLPSIDAYHSPIYSRKKVQEETSKAFSLSKSRTSTTLYELSSGSKETPSKSAFSAIKPRSENMTRNKISPNSYTSPCPPSLINENLRSPPLLYPPERLPEKQNKSHSTPHENSQNVVYDSLISKTLSSKERPVTLEMERNKDPFNLNRPNYERGAYMEKYREEISNYKNIEEGSDRRENFRREHIPVDIVKPQSPDGVTRNIAIQRQLENQKRWIDEHDSREQIQASLRKNKYEQQINTHTGNSSSDVNGYQRSVSVKPNGHQFSPMQIVDPRQKQLEIQKQQEELEKKLSLYAQEIEELKRQKEMLVSAQSSLANDEILRQQVTMETQLRKLQEFRQAQALQMLRNNSQSALGVQLLANNINNISATSISPQLCNTVQLLNNNANQQFGNNIIQQNQIAAASVLAKANNNFINSPLNNGLSAQLNSNLNLNQAQMQLALNKSPQLIKGGQGVNLAAGNVQAFSQTVLAQQLNNQKYPNVAQVPVNIDNSRLISKDRKERLTNVELNAIRAAEIQQAMSRKSGREILPNSSYSEFNKVTSGDLYRNQSFSPGNNYLQGRAQVNIFFKNNIIKNKYLFSPFITTDFFLYLLKTSESLWFTDLFIGDRKRPVARSALREKCPNTEVLLFRIQTSKTPYLDPFHAVMG